MHSFKTLNKCFLTTCQLQLSSFRSCKNMFNRCLQVHLLLTFSWPCFPRSQHLGHSQLFGRSSFSIPSFDRSGYFWWRHDGWRIFQQMPHSISGDDSFPRFSAFPPAAEEQGVEEVSPFSQMTQTAAVGSIGWSQENKVTVRREFIFVILDILDMWLALQMMELNAIQAFVMCSQFETCCETQFIVSFTMWYRAWLSRHGEILLCPANGIHSKPIQFKIRVVKVLHLVQIMLQNCPLILNQCMMKDGVA